MFEHYARVPEYLIDEWADEPLMVALLTHLFRNANRKNKRWKGMDLLPGQIIFGREEWARKTGISEQTLRTFINRLKSTGEITSKSTSKFTLLTIEKWREFFPLKAEPTGEITEQSTSNQPATNQQLTTSQKIDDISKKEDITLLSESACAKKIEISDYERKSFSTFAGEITKRLGPVNTTGLVPGWITVGVDLELDVIPTIDRIMKANPGKTYGLKYFEKPILESCAMRKIIPVLPIVDKGNSYEINAGSHHTIDNSGGSIVRPRNGSLAHCGTKVKSASDKWDGAWVGALEQNSQ